MSTFGPSWSAFGTTQGGIVGERYRLERILGAGAMGVVAEAAELGSGTRVAIKVLRIEAADDPDTVERFLREARAATHMVSPHVVRILDVGSLASGSPYLVMEYLEGEDLHAMLDREGFLPVETACRYSIEACEALATAHAAQIIHRDVKPHNLFLARRGHEVVLKVLDFGISKQVAPGELTALTDTQNALGTPVYMSPEQMMSARRVDARADVWSLGVVLHQLLCGRLPFETESLPELIAWLVDPEVRAPGPRRFRAEVPEKLDAVVRRCLEKDVTLRYPDMAALADALAPFAGGQGRLAAKRVRAALHGTEKTPVPARSVLIAAGVAILVAGVVWALR